MKQKFEGGSVASKELTSKIKKVNKFNDWVEFEILTFSGKVGKIDQKLKNQTTQVEKNQLEKQKQVLQRQLRILKEGLEILNDYLSKEIR